MSDRLPVWVVNLDTGRFGDWVIVEAEDEEAAKKKLTRTQRKKILSVKRSYRKSEQHLIPQPPKKRRR